MENQKVRLVKTKDQLNTGLQHIPKHTLKRELETLLKSEIPEIVEIYPDISPKKPSVPEHVLKNMRKPKNKDKKVVETGTAHVFFPLYGLHMRGIRYLKNESGKTYVFFPYQKSPDGEQSYPTLDFENKARWKKIKDRIIKEICKEV